MTSSALSLLTNPLRLVGYHFQFEAHLIYTEPGDCLLSDGVSSELMPRVIWKLRVFPNGFVDERRGRMSVSLDLFGQMVGF